MTSDDFDIPFDLPYRHARTDPAAMRRSILIDTVLFIALFVICTLASIGFFFLAGN